MGSTGNTSSTGTGFFSGGGGGISPTAPTNQALTPNVTIQPVNQNNPQVENQAPNDQNTPVTPNGLQALANMSDDELAATVIASRNVKMPNFLADANDPTQKFVFQAGLNDRPQVLDANEFNQFLKDNGIKQSEIIARSVNGASYKNQLGYTVTYSAQQVQDMLKYSKLTYIGGKQGGQAYGAGAYFAMVGMNATGYGGNTAYAVLNPNTAKIISENELLRTYRTFAQSHPKFARAVGSPTSGRGGNLSIWALAMGYNVITDHDAKNGTYIRGGYGDYYNVIDRSALVYHK